MTPSPVIPEFSKGGVSPQLFNRFKQAERRARMIEIHQPILSLVVKMAMMDYIAVTGWSENSVSFVVEGDRRVTFLHALHYLTEQSRRCVNLIPVEFTDDVSEEKYVQWTIEICVSPERTFEIYLRELITACETYRRLF